MNENKEYNRKKEHSELCEKWDEFLDEASNIINDGDELDSEYQPLLDDILVRTYKYFNNIYNEQETEKMKLDIYDASLYAQVYAYSKMPIIMQDDLFEASVIAAELLYDVIYDIICGLRTPVTPYFGHTYYLVEENGEEVRKPLTYDFINGDLTPIIEVLKLLHQED